MILNKLLKLHEIDVLGILSLNGSTFYLPTTFCIREPSVVAPKQGRSFNTGFYLVDGEVKTYFDIASLPGFKGTVHFNEIILTEVWEDCGTEGHVGFKITGYMFLDGETFDKAMSKFKGDSRPCSFPPLETTDKGGVIYAP